jgi:hypothetical protein
LLDRAFQNFVLNLGDFHNSEDPILRARRALKGQQVQDTEAAMSGFKTGSLWKLANRVLCLKHQCVGSCSSKCGMTHVDPKKLDETTKKSIDDRLKAIFG